MKEGEYERESHLYYRSHHLCRYVPQNYLRFARLTYVATLGKHTPQTHTQTRKEKSCRFYFSPENTHAHI